MGLSLVQYDPNDYKLSTVLSSGIGNELSTIEQISSAFALYFSWQKESTAWVRFAKDASKPCSCVISKDDEERNITQVYISLSIEQLGVEKFYQNAFVRIIVFENCFEFEAEILDAWVEDEMQWLVVQVPSSMKALRTRKSPRAHKESNQKSITWVSNEESKEILAQSVGLNSVVLNAHIEPGTLGQIVVDGNSFRAKCVRNNSQSSFLEIEFGSDLESGIFFETYAKYRYPRLKKRSNFSFDKVINLYQRAGFFSNFSGKFDEPDRFNKVISTWEDIKEAEHSLTIDYCIEKDDQLIGASSLGLCLKSKDQDYWVFHQLCSDKDNSDYDDTGDLYTWRAEYLWSRSSNITTVFWFRSASRWLERIYVKFLQQNPSCGELREGNTYSYLHQATSSPAGETLKLPFGVESRAYKQDEPAIAGAGPDYVHANRNMNIILSKDGNWNDVINAADSICNTLGRKEMYFRVDLPPGHTPPIEANCDKQMGSDRFARIDKSGMLDLVACIKHSIAVTKAKKGAA